MHPDEPTPSEGRALSAEEIGARVSAILEAAERDARAVIDAAHREAAEPPPADVTLDGLAAEVDALAARVSTIERALAARERRDSDEDPHGGAERRSRRAAMADAAACVRAIELALAGYSRDAIARELASSVPPTEIESVLDEVLSR